VTASISRHLILWLAIPLMVLALCGALVHYFNSVAPSVLESDRRLREANLAVMAHLGDDDGKLVVRDQLANVPALPSRATIRFAVRDSVGQLLAGDAQIPVAPLNGAAPPVFAMLSIEGHNQRTLTTRVDTGNRAVFITSADLSHGAGTAARYGFMSTLLWDFVQLDITLVLVWVGIQLGLKPVQRLREEVGARSPHDLRPITDAAVPREIAPLVATLNRLFSMLRSSVQSQQQFIANTAHQLRTPITGMQAQLDLLIAEPAAKPIEDRLLTLQQGVKQLAHASNQLLTLARADPAANIAGKVQAVDLVALVGDVAARFFDRALQLNLDLGVDARPATLLADPSLLDDLLSNLVDNALKYTPQGAVTVSCGLLAGKPFLAVEDTGCGIPEGERAQVRQRFYRRPGSPGHGSGLGLAIVDEIARLYGANASISHGAGGRGTRVEVRFP
jgi:two-component system, OmpR family, sensor histidine kinase TctE